jgi:hypothetical protein
MPPKWALGFHHSRYGFESIDAVSKVVEKYREHDIPLDSKYGIQDQPRSQVKQSLILSVSHLVGH